MDPIVKKLFRFSFRSQPPETINKFKTVISRDYDISDINDIKIEEMNFKYNEIKSPDLRYYQIYKRNSDSTFKLLTILIMDRKGNFVREIG